MQRSFVKNKGLTQSKGFTVFLARQHYILVYNLQYILSGSWSPSLSVVDAVMVSSAASSPGSTCTQ